MLANSAGSFAQRHPVAREPSLASHGSLPRSTNVPFRGAQKRATAAEIAYVGTTGTNGRYGSNIMQITADVAAQYQYTIEFINQGSAVQQCKCWNKIGPDGGINGCFTGNEAITFSLAAGSQQFIALEENSQIGCSCHAGAIPLTPYGQFASTWVEADFSDEANGKRSGFDASCLVAARYHMDIPGLSVCGPQNVCSTIYPGGTGENAYLEGMEHLDIVPPIEPGPVALTVRVDFS